MSSSLYSYQTTFSEWREDGYKKETGLQCDNGSRSFVYYYPSTKRYHSSSNNSFSSFHDAAKSSCNKSYSKSNKIILLKNGGIFCKTGSTMKETLKSGVNYTLARLRSGDNNSNCGRLEGNQRAYFIKQYYLTNYLEDGKRRNYIDNYVKIKAGGEYYFIRNNDLK